jgi:hypothetical protein
MGTLVSQRAYSLPAQFLGVGNYSACTASDSSDPPVESLAMFEFIYTDRCNERVNNVQSFPSCVVTQ